VNLQECIVSYVRQPDRILCFCTQMKVKNNKGEEITRPVKAQWMLRVMELTHIDVFGK
jgi:hypothetical protein